MIKAGTKCLAAVAVAAGLALSAAAPARAQTKDLSDDSIYVLMGYAWQLTPAKFTTPEGRTILVDKSKRDEVIVPIETAREVVRVARLTAFAQICELTDAQAANYQVLMRREIGKKKWTEQQTLYISQLHLFTVMLLTGKVSVSAKEGSKDVVITEGKPVKADSCSDTERTKVREQIKTYVESAPVPPLPPEYTSAGIGQPGEPAATQPATGAVAPAPAAAAKAAPVAQPGPAPQKK
jgi:hypothetical protein